MGMKLSPGRLNALLAELGQDVTWRKAYCCPCRTEYSGAAVEGCPVCGGRGWTWGEPIAGYLGLTGQKVQHEWKQFGEYMEGDVVVTLPSNSSTYGIGDYDRVRFPNSSTDFNVSLRRGRTDSPLPFSPISIERCWWIDDENQVVDGDPPTVGADDVPVWPAGAVAPDEGRQYGMRGRRYLEYFRACSGYGQDRHHQHGDALPRKAVLRRFDLFGR